MRLALLVVVAFALRNVVAIPPSWDQLDESYTFERYVEDFAKSYSKDEWDQRKDIFGRNLVRILAHNRQRKTGHVLGVNQFMDFKPEEVPTGHDKRYQRARAVSLDRSSRTPHPMDLPFEIDDVATLPSDVDWRRAGIVTPVKDQGMCGSCWAFASTAALESHIAQETGLLFSLSVQELVSCSPNTRECGGQGGCLGSTAELAYDFVASEGMVEEWRFGYASYNGEKVACSLLDRNLRGVDGSVVTIDGYAVTPLNDYVAVMNAVAKYGPVVVNVAAHEWSLYAGGVFHSMSNKPSSYDINHDVVLVGYGTDEATGEDYWLIRNSWSPQWGKPNSHSIVHEALSTSHNCVSSR